MDDAAQPPAQSGQVDKDSGVGSDFDLTFLSAANATFIAEMNAAWRRDPSAVDKRWAAYFEQLNALGEVSPEIDAGPSWARCERRIVVATDPAESVNAVAAGHAAGRVMNATDMRAATLDSLRAVMLIRAYRIRGHLLADLDPLALENKPLHPELDPATYGFTAEDWDRPIFINYVLGLETATLREIVELLRKTIAAQSVWNLCISRIQHRRLGSRNASRLSATALTLPSAARRRSMSALLMLKNSKNICTKNIPAPNGFGMDGAEAMIPA